MITLSRGIGLYRSSAVKTVWKFEASDESMHYPFDKYLCSGGYDLLTFACTGAAQQVEPSDEQELVRLLNQERSRAGLPSLWWMTGSQVGPHAFRADG